MSDPVWVASWDDGKDPGVPKKTHLAEIIGGVAGGAALVTLIAVLAWYFSRKKRVGKDLDITSPSTPIGGLKK